jgi:solute carrier family 26 (sodium-independent sulfate anion transporter), member 11
MADARTKIGHGLAKVLGIKLDDQIPEPVTRGESVFSISSVDTYVETEPTSGEWIREHVPSGHQIVQYFLSLFPFLQWIAHYNLQWLVGDLVAGMCFQV